ncbi:MepB family protein [Paenibacillus shenyangensis]|uniref:MepB family protein n=1 Tax=Paenibacillus sp. A9 TaxID=1284352 RepID=UPI00037D1994|nr:mep operon protein MepB [Paenibacillus sp. A9]
MSIFQQTLTHIQEVVYIPAGWHIDHLHEEKQNAEYGAGIFQLHQRSDTSLSVRFRVAKTTPTKAGQFVVFWQKNAEKQNQPFTYEESADLLVIHVIHPATSENGQFVFPKDVLKKHGILSTDDNKGKMAMRVYPSWDEVTSKQAIATQKWQLPYFAKLDTEKLTKLYKS